MDRKVIIKSHGSGSSSPYGSSSSSVLQHKSFKARKGWGIAACLKHPSRASTQRPACAAGLCGAGTTLILSLQRSRASPLGNCLQPGSGGAWCGRVGDVGWGKEDDSRIHQPLRLLKRKGGAELSSPEARRDGGISWAPASGPLLGACPTWRGCCWADASLEEVIPTVSAC